MDFGSFLNDTWKNIGNFFGVNQRKKQDDNPPPQPTFQRPSGPVSLNLPQNNNSILNTPSTLQAPKSFIPGQDQNNNPLVLGGVRQSQQPQPQPQAVQQAHDMIANHGTGAPFSPDVIKAAQNNTNLPPNPSNFNPANLKPKDPWWLKAAHGFIGAENDAGGLVGTALGSVLPFGDSNIYSQKGRDNLAKDFQNETYNPNTGQWFKTGTDFANKAQSDINRGDVEATLGDMGTTVLNAASLIPAEGLAVGGVNAARTAAEQGGKQLFKDAAKGGIVPGIFGLGMGASQAAQNDASPLDILKSSLEGGATGYALGSLVPVAGNAAGRFRNRISNRTVQDGTDLVDEQLGNDAGRTITEEPVTQQPETPATPQTPRDPSSPITASPTTNKAPAITSPNRPATPPTVQPPRPLFPQAADNAGVPTAQPMIVQAPEAPSVNVNVPTADQATAAAQKAVEDAAAKPAPAPAETQVAPVETPEAVASKEAAAQAPPVSPEAVAAAEAQAAHQAPTEAIANEVPSYTSPHRTGKAGVPGNTAVNYNTGDTNLDSIINDSIIAHKGTAGTAETRANALDKAGISAAQRAKVRNIAVKSVDKQTGRITPEGQQAIRDILTGKDIPVSEVTTAPTATQPITSTETPTPGSSDLQLGNITRNAILDGSINTPEGVDETIRAVTTTAHEAADAAGTTLEDIIKKGQKVWEQDPKANTETAARLVEGFTPEQQKVYKDYSQELSTLRDRSGHSLKGGDQGPWYGPRQFLDENSASREYDPSLVNELRRTGVKSDGLGNSLDYSATPYEHYIRRYADAPSAGMQRLVDAVENKVVTKDGISTSTPTGIKVPDSVKSRLEADLRVVTEKRDAEERLRASGDLKEADKVHNEVQSATNKAFNNLMQDVPGTGAARREVINNIKAMRGTYEQTLAQSVGLSNVVNRVADQGTKGMETLKRPLVNVLRHPFSKFYAKRVMPNTVANLPNFSKEAAQAAKEFGRGALLNEIKDNFRASLSNAGAGRNPIAKGIAKADALVRGTGAAAVQAGDLSTPNIIEALKIGASRPEARGLKTVSDYQKYFADYTQTHNFRDDLARGVEKIQNPKIGLAGGEIQGAGNLSNGLSREVDNAISTNANRLKQGLGNNRVVREMNDYFKTNFTGYAGVGSRVLGTVRDAALPIKPLMNAAKEARSGDPAAVARATNLASHAVADSLAAYGAAGAAVALAKSGVIGYTGSQPVRGSSQSAYNKAHNIPANQWYINVGGNRIYFDPARAAGAPGVLADVAGAIVTGSNPGDTATNVAGQIYNQGGGSSLPDNIVNAKTAYLDSGAPESDKKYARGQVAAMFAPSTGILNNAANWQDPAKRAPKNFVDDLKSNLPVLRSQVPVATDSRGNTIPNSKQVSGGSSMVSVGQNTDSPTVKAADPVSAEIDRLQKVNAQLFPTAANTNATDKHTQDFAQTLLGTDTYKSADDKGKADMLKTVLDGSKTKDINASLSNTDKQSILEHTLQGKKGKAWLDDTKNAANYYTAAYDNAKLNKTLTVDDNDLENKSGLRYQAVGAQVDQKFGADHNLREMYKKISETDFRKMLTPDNADYNPKLATQLYKYDQARTKAGVSGAKFSDKPKFNLDAKLYGTKGGRRGSGGGVSASDKFAFASLPSSLIGTGSRAGSGSQYAPDAPLFKPIPDLQPAVGAPIPKGRTISVKKGR